MSHHRQPNMTMSARSVIPTPTFPSSRSDIPLRVMPSSTSHIPSSTHWTDRGSLALRSASPKSIRDPYSLPTSTSYAQPSQPVIFRPTVTKLHPIPLVGSGSPRITPIGGYAALPPTISNHHFSTSRRMIPPSSNIQTLPSVDVYGSTATGGPPFTNISGSTTRPASAEMLQRRSNITISTAAMLPQALSNHQSASLRRSSSQVSAELSQHSKRDLPSFRANAPVDVSTKTDVSSSHSPMPNIGNSIPPKVSTTHAQHRYPVYRHSFSRQSITSSSSYQPSNNPLAPSTSIDVNPITSSVGKTFSTPINTRIPPNTTSFIHATGIPMTHQAVPNPSTKSITRSAAKQPSLNEPSTATSTKQLPNMSSTIAPQPTIHDRVLMSIELLGTKSGQAPLSSQRLPPPPHSKQTTTSSLPVGLLSESNTFVFPSNSSFALCPFHSFNLHVTSTDRSRRNPLIVHISTIDTSFFTTVIPSSDSSNVTWDYRTMFDLKYRTLRLCSEQRQICSLDFMSLLATRHNQFTGKFDDDRFTVSITFSEVQVPNPKAQSRESLGTSHKLIDSNQRSNDLSELITESQPSDDLPNSVTSCPKYISSDSSNEHIPYKSLRLIVKKLEGIDFALFGDFSNQIVGCSVEYGKSTVDFMGPFQSLSTQHLVTVFPAEFRLPYKTSKQNIVKINFLTSTMTQVSNTATTPSLSHAIKPTIVGYATLDLRSLIATGDRVFGGPLPVTTIHASDTLSSAYISVAFLTDEVLEASVNSRLPNIQQTDSPIRSLPALSHLDQVEQGPTQQLRQALTASACTSLDAQSCAQTVSSGYNVGSNIDPMASSSPLVMSDNDHTGPDIAVSSSEATHIAFVVEDIAHTGGSLFEPSQGSQDSDTPFLVRIATTTECKEVTVGNPSLLKVAPGSLPSHLQVELYDSIHKNKIIGSGLIKMSPFYELFDQSASSQDVSDASQPILIKTFDDDGYPQGQIMTRFVLVSSGDVDLSLDLEASSSLATPNNESDIGTTQSKASLWGGLLDSNSHPICLQPPSIDQQEKLSQKDRRSSDELDEKLNGDEESELDEDDLLIRVKRQPDVKLNSPQQVGRIQDDEKTAGDMSLRNDENDLNQLRVDGQMREMMGPTVDSTEEDSPSRVERVGVDCLRPICIADSTRDTMEGCRVRGKGAEDSGDEIESRNGPLLKTEEMIIGGVVNKKLFGIMGDALGSRIGTILAIDEQQERLSVPNTTIIREEAAAMGLMCSDTPDIPFSFRPAPTMEVEEEARKAGLFHSVAKKKVDTEENVGDLKPDNVDRKGLSVNSLRSSNGNVFTQSSGIDATKDDKNENVTGAAGVQTTESIKCSSFWNGVGQNEKSEVQQESAQGPHQTEQQKPNVKVPSLQQSNPKQQRGPKPKRGTRSRRRNHHNK